MPNSGLMLIESGKQTGAGRTTTGRVVKLAEANSALGKFVQIRGRYLAAKTTKIRETHVVGHDQNDVGLLLGKTI
jgi:hypothetical protein